MVFSAGYVRLPPLQSHLELTSLKDLSTATPSPLSSDVRTNSFVEDLSRD